MESNEKVRNEVKEELGINKKRLVNSFKYAFCGIKQAFLGEQNLRIHIFMAILVIICGFLFKISYLEWVSCLILIALVLMAEMFNTAIEYVVDLASPEVHPLAKAAKDVASAGVLMMAIISATLGLIIFVPKFIEFIGGLL
jgi:diacylglycerol kinase